MPNRHIRRACIVRATMLSTPRLDLPACMPQGGHGTFKGIREGETVLIGEYEFGRYLALMGW